MVRKLASIQKVRKLIPIHNADRIELALVNDWTCIVKKGEFSVGDDCVYFEIDSLLPDEERYSFLASSKKDYFGSQKYRIKTMKMKGVLSQGLALPLSYYPEMIHFKEGDDITELLNIIKYDPEFYNDNGSKPKTGNSKGKFPSFLSKSDQERIQNLPHYYETYKDHLWEETLKLDGSSMTVYKHFKKITFWDKVKLYLGFKIDLHQFGVCSRNLELSRSDDYSKTFINNGKESEYVQSDFWKIAIKLKLEKYLPVGYALQGELIGPKIQSNHEKVTENQFWVYDVYDINESRYLLPGERHSFIQCYFPHGLNHVPVVDYVQVFDICDNLESLQERVKGESMNPKTVSEGRVYKSCIVHGLSFKCISNEYLLKDKS